VDEGSAVPEMVIVAVASSKPVFQINWWQIEHLLNLLSLFAWWQLVQLVVQLLFSLNMEVLTTAGSGLQKFTLETEVVTELLPYSRWYNDAVGFSFILKMYMMSHLPGHHFNHYNAACRWWKCKRLSLV
jgi:hypothetical protein